MLDYARKRAKEALSFPHTVVMATSGPAGVQAGEFPCEALDLQLFLLVPRVSDHLYNLENEPGVTLLTAEWELKGKALVVPAGPFQHKLSLFADPGAKWCVLVMVEPWILQIKRKQGWGNLETIDLKIT